MQFITKQVLVFYLCNHWLIMMSTYTYTEKCDANFGSSCMLNPGIHIDLESECHTPFDQWYSYFVVHFINHLLAGTISSESIFVIEPY